MRRTSLLSSSTESKPTTCCKKRCSFGFDDGFNETSKRGWNMSTTPPAAASTWKRPGKKEKTVAP